MNYLAHIFLSGSNRKVQLGNFVGDAVKGSSYKNYPPDIGHYKIFCVNGKYGIQVEFRIFYFIALQNEEDYERKESSSA